MTTLPTHTVRPQGQHAVERIPQVRPGQGLAQAQAARSFLADQSLQRAYTSSMSRPRRTAEVILEGSIPADVAAADTCTASGLLPA